MMSQSPPSNSCAPSSTGVQPKPKAGRQAQTCLRCGYEWFSRVQNPSQCPSCHSVLWNTPRAQQLEGKPAPTRKGKARGGSFTPKTSERANRIKAELAAESEDAAEPT